MFVFQKLTGCLVSRLQVERKRHTGNDIVNIVFVDGDVGDGCDFAPSCIKSQFTRILFQTNKQPFNNVILPRWRTIRLIKCESMRLGSSNLTNERMAMASGRQLFKLLELFKAVGLQNRIRVERLLNQLGIHQMRNQVE